MLRNRPWLVAMLQVVGWLLFLSFPLLMRPDNNGGHPPGGWHRQQPDNHMFMPYMHIIMNGLMIPLFYFNTNVIYPYFFNRKRYGLFALVQVGIILCVIGAQRLLAYLFFHGFRHPFPWLFMVATYLFVAMVAYSYLMFRESILREQQSKEKENAMLQSELSFLRWQISPHFLFNVLNNMVALARRRSENLEPMLVQLSTLMRYMVYETGERKVALKQEADYLRSYIDLQSMRFGEEVHVQFLVSIPGDVDAQIEPMLLVPFVENAFKHGTGLVEDPVINIRLDYENGGLKFVVENKYRPNATDSKDDTHGIGMNNVRRRLNLLYPGRHTLDIECSGNWYKSFLTLDL